MAVKKKGPSRKSGALSVGIALLAMVWTAIIYMREGAGFQALLGVILVFLCLAHARYNFSGTKQDEPSGSGAHDKKASGRYPVYHVKKKPGKVLKR